jgi:hypothetical protein
MARRDIFVMHIANTSQSTAGRLVGWNNNRWLSVGYPHGAPTLQGLNTLRERYRLSTLVLPALDQFHNDPEHHLLTTRPSPTASRDQLYVYAIPCTVATSPGSTRRLYHIY